MSPTGNPLFVREGPGDGRRMWDPDRPPRTVLDVVRARLDSVSAGCRNFVQTAAIVGRDFSVALVATALDEPAAWCLPLTDEAIAYGLLDRVGDHGGYRFAALTGRGGGSLDTADRWALHRGVAEAIQTQFAGDLSEHLGISPGPSRRCTPGRRRVRDRPVGSTSRPVSARRRRTLAGHAPNRRTGDHTVIQARCRLGWHGSPRTDRGVARSRLERSGFARLLSATCLHPCRVPLQTRARSCKRLRIVPFPLVRYIGGRLSSR